MNFLYHNCYPDKRWIWCEDPKRTESVVAGGAQFHFCTVSNLTLLVVHGAGSGGSHAGKNDTLGTNFNRTEQVTAGVVHCPGQRITWRAMLLLEIEIQCPTQYTMRHVKL